MENKTLVTSFTLHELEAECVKSGFPKYRAKQILDWVYRKGVTDFKSMTNLSAEIQSTFADSFMVISSKVEQVFASKDGTRKLLVKLADGNCIETVVLSDAGRTTLCISTQAGCPVKCHFCASGQKGLIRSLEANEIVEQVLLAQQMSIEQGALSNKIKVNNIVVMGMGEPFLNYDNLIKALTILNAEWGMGLGLNRITVSTVGIPDKIIQFAREKVATNLAISLHAPNDELRREIIPMAEKIKINEIIKAAGKYRALTRKDVTLEYLMIDEFNTGKDHAGELAKLAKESWSKINLIAYNEVKGLPYKSPSYKTIEDFQNILKSRGIIAMLRKSKGADIAAACGQLALQGK
ncbi:MAG: 23S rRNA (adenine(2503)-C(2))-methyltransferase RlmN [Planctomycetes bacterium]|nr:23S rRNA (adenine(2503)-C(2))-methyltransferase RlmN [Planctomycetota bacterium]